jgi:hypothetical protein
MPSVSCHVACILPCHLYPAMPVFCILPCLYSVSCHACILYLVYFVFVGVFGVFWCISVVFRGYFGGIGSRSRPVVAMVTSGRVVPSADCTALHCTALHCTALHCTALHCTALHCTALHCTALHCTALHCQVPTVSRPTGTLSGRPPAPAAYTYTTLHYTTDSLGMPALDT